MAERISVRALPSRTIPPTARTGSLKKGSVSPPSFNGRSIRKSLEVESSDACMFATDGDETDAVMGAGACPAALAAG